MNRQKNTTYIIRHEKHTIESKTNKVQKKPWNNVLFRV